MLKHITMVVTGLLLVAGLGARLDAGVATVWNFNGDLATTYGPGGMYYMDEDDAAHNPPGIPTGNSAYRTGTPPVGHVSTQSLTSFGTANIGGADFGYMTFPKATDTWTGYYVDHTYGPTPAGGLSQYTMMFDLRVPQSSFSTDAYMALFETNSSNGSAGDLFVGLTAAGRQGAIGISTIGYSSPGVIQPDTWHRVAWVYDQSKTVNPNDRTASIYVDGALVHQSPDTFTTESRFRPHHTGATGSNTIINPMQGFFLGTSATVGENSSADLASFLFVDRPMTQLEIQSLGGASANGLLDAVSPSPGVTAIQALSPTHYYRLNEATANTATASVIDSGGVPMTAAHVGDFSAGGAWAGANGVWLPGFEKGNAGLFHNDAGAVKLGNMIDFSPSTMTVSLWFKATDPTAPGGITDRLFQNNAGTNRLTIGLWDGKGLAIDVGGTSTSDLMLPESTVTLHDGRWHHVVAVRNGADVNNAMLYVDGVQYGSAQLVDTGSGWGNTGSTTWIGARNVGGADGDIGLFSGTSDEVSIWLNRALNATEVQSLYNAARTPAELPVYAAAVLDKGPVAYYRLNEPAGLNAGETVVNWANQGTTSTNVLGDANAGINDTSAAGMVPTFSVAGPRPTDTIGGRNLNGLESDNTAAQFFADGGVNATPDTTINLGTNPALLNSENLTYSLLFKSSSNEQYMRMVVTDPGASNDFFLVLHEGRLGLVVDANDGAGGAIALRTDTLYSDDEWHHVVAVREGDLGTDARLYVDGQLVSLSSFSVGTWGLATSAMIGARGDDRWGFIGLLDEVAIWDRALTGTDVRALYNALTIPEPGSAVLLVLGALAGVLLGGRRRRQRVCWQ